MKEYKNWIAILFAVAAPVLYAQDRPQTWSFRKCVEYAHEHNIQIRQSELSLEQSRVDTREAKAQLFPSLSVSVGQSVSNTPFNSTSGKSKTEYTGSYGVNSSLALYEGGARRKTVEMNELQNRIQELQVDEARNDIELAITETYLQILYADESVRINENTLAVSEAQLDRARKFRAAGSISQSDLAQMESQYSTDKYQLVVSRTTLDEMKLQLKQLLELGISDEMELEMPELDDQDVLVAIPSKEEVYETALVCMPQIAGSKLSVDAAEVAKAKAKSGYLPTLSLNASVGTGHVSGTDLTLGNKFKNSFNENIGLSLGIPIFNNRKTKSAVERAEISLASSNLDYTNTQKELLKTIESIYQDAVSAQNRYLAAQESVKANEESFRLVSQQFDLGIKTTLDLLVEKNNLVAAQQESVQAKYMTILNLQLLRFYQNQPIVL